MSGMPQHQPAAGQEPPNNVSTSVLHLFRSHPSPFDAGAATSLQGFETALFLIALRRFPHALTSCVFAIEAVIRYSVQSSRRLKDLLPESPERALLSPGLRPNEIKELRDARNKIVHKGFDSNDESKSAALLLRTGIPLLEHYFNGLYRFDIMDGLLEEFAYHLGVAKTVYQRKCAAAGEEDTGYQDLTYCFRSFSHLLNERIRLAETPDWMHAAATRADETGTRWESVKKFKDSAERAFACPYEFDCPVCGEVDSVVADLESSGLERGVVIPFRLVCADCELVVAPQHLFLAEELLRDQAIEKRAAILKGYGFEA
jgi:hypothetical protein